VIRVGPMANAILGHRVIKGAGGAWAIPSNWQAPRFLHGQIGVVIPSGTTYYDPFTELRYLDVGAPKQPPNGLQRITEYLGGLASMKTDLPAKAYLTIFVRFRFPVFRRWKAG